MCTDNGRFSKFRKSKFSEIKRVLSNSPNRSIASLPSIDRAVSDPVAAGSAAAQLQRIRVSNAMYRDL